MASKKRKKAKKPAKRGRKKSAARASSAKRGKRVSLSMAQLRALTKGKGRKKAKRGGGRRHSSDHFDFAMSYDDGKLPIRSLLSGVSMSATERKLLNDVNRSARAIEALENKNKEQERRLKEQARLERYRDMSQDYLDELRAERSAKTAEREAKLKLAIAKHRQLVNNAIDRLGGKGVATVEQQEIIEIAKNLGKVRKAS